MMSIEEVRSAVMGHLFSQNCEFMKDDPVRGGNTGISARDPMGRTVYVEVIGDSTGHTTPMRYWSRREYERRQDRLSIALYRTLLVVRREGRSGAMVGIAFEESTASLELIHGICPVINQFGIRLYVVDQARNVKELA